MDVLTIGAQVQNRISDDLAWAMVGHVTASPGFVHLDAERVQTIRCRQNVGPAAAADPDGQDMRMLEEEQRIGNSAGASLLDELGL